MSGLQITKCTFGFILCFIVKILNFSFSFQKLDDQKADQTSYQMACRSPYHKVLTVFLRVCVLHTLEKSELSNNVNVFELWIKKKTRTTKIHEKVRFMESDIFSQVFCSSIPRVFLYNHNHIYDCRRVQEPQLTYVKKLPIGNRDSHIFKRF